jgi:ParB-like chromosome segregation protein Spo0J
LRGTAGNSLGIDDSPAPSREVRLIPLASIRADGGAQHRITLDQRIVEEYAELMRAGVEFPPISVRCDTTHYWPSDGFQRIDAAKLAGLSEIRSEVVPGTQEDAQWDSYSANATHGLRRTAAETERVIERALRHPESAGFTNVQLAKHLHVSEPTVRRWRKKLSSSRDEDSCQVRLVTRCGTTYGLNGNTSGAISKR